jgi:tetratricopeptide (TPR) repeat protein
MPLSAGDKLGPYEILAPIGAGGMGEVYRARDPRLGRDVAIKVLPETIARGSAWNRFEREARAASALSHPNICAVYDVGEASGRPFLVMELLEGKTLRDFTHKQPLEPKTAVALGLQMADALEAAHAKGITHRDIKPSNIMVTGRSHVKVLDFGLAKYVGVGDVDETLTAAGTLMGTPHYLSPEVLQGKPADARSDLWALGVVLYEMLSGRLPFLGSTMFQVSSAILREEPSPLPANVPSRLRRIVERCLEKEPEGRYQNAGEVHTALETTRAAATPTRKRWFWTVGASVALVVAVLVWQFRPRTGARLTSTGAPASASQEANLAFEQAMQFQRVQNDMPKAQQALERAILLDPNFAEALRYHAFNYLIEILNGYSNDIGQVYKAEEELLHASRLDPNLVSLPTAFTAVYMMEGRKDRVPMDELDRVLKRQPSNNDARLWRAILHWLVGHNVAAKEDLGIILQSEPLNGAARMFLGEILHTEGDLQGSIDEEQKILLQAPGNISAIRWLAFTYMDADDLEKARVLLEEKRPLFSQNYMWRATWALLLARGGKRDEAIEAMDDETLKFLGAAFPSTLTAAEFYSVLAEPSKAVEWLEKAVRNGDERVEWFQRDPSLANIRRDPRFQRIIDSIEERRRPRQAQ